MLFAPVQVSVSELGWDSPRPLVCEPPFVLLLLRTGVVGNVHVEFGPAATYVPPASSQRSACPPPPGGGGGER